MSTGQVSCGSCKRVFPNTGALQQHQKAKSHQGMGSLEVRSRSRSRRRNSKALSAPPATNPVVSRATSSLPPPITATRSPRNMALRPLIEKYLGGNVAGREWAIRALHPCDEAAGGGTRIPDLSVDQTAAMEGRSFVTFTAPATATVTWDLQVLVLGLADVPYCWRSKPTAEAWDQRNHPWVAGVIPSFKPAFYKPGWVDTSALPAVLHNANYDAGDGNQDSDLRLNATQFRQTFRGLTLHMTASNLVNGGSVTAGQWGEKAVRESPGRFTIDNVNPPEGATGDATEYIRSTTIDTWTYADVPGSQAELVAKCPGAAVWEAKRGVYLPLRYEDPAHLYTAPTTAEQITTVEGKVFNTVVLPVKLRRSDNPGDDGFMPGQYIWNKEGAPVTGGKLNPGFSVVASAGPVNQQVGMIIFEGLDKAAPITLKVRDGLQLVPEVNSLWAPFAESAPPPDRQALDAVILTQRQLPLAYEASYNDLGTILSMIAKFALPVLKFVGGSVIGAIAKRFTGQPTASRAANGTYQTEAVD